MAKRIFVALLCVFLFEWVGIGAVSERSPTLDEVQMLFERLTRPVPYRMFLQAEEEVLEKKANEDEIIKALKDQEKIMAQEDSRLSPAQKNKLREARLNNLRGQLSGRRKVLDKVWVSGRLYRGEQQNLLIKSGNFAFVNIGDPTFAKGITGFVLNKDIDSASVFENPSTKFAEIPLWQAFTVEPELAFVFLVTVADQVSLTNALTNVFSSSFAGYKLDRNKAQTLVTGRNPDLTLLVRTANVTNSETTLEYILTSKVKQGFVWRFLFKMGSSVELQKIQTEGVQGYLSVRESYDTNGFPRYWMTEGKVGNNSTEKKVVRFQVVDLNPDFDDWKTFGPSFPTNFNVAKILPDGRGIPMQRPLAGTMIDLKPVDLNNSRIPIRIVIGTVLLLPVLVMSFMAIKRRSPNRMI